MSAARQLLTALLLAALLTGCVDFNHSPPPGTEPDPDDQIHAQGPEINWETHFGEYAHNEQTFLAAGTAGTLYLTANTAFGRLDKDGRPIGNRAKVYLLNPSTGNRLRSATDLVVEGAEFWIKGVAPSANDSAFVFGYDYATGEDGIVHRVLPDGTLAWNPLRIPGPNLTLVGGEALPEGQLLLYGQIIRAGEPYLWLARISPDGTIINESSAIPYPGEAMKDATYVAAPSGPQGGFFLMLRSTQECPKLNETCGYQGRLDVIDLDDLQYAHSSIPLTPSPTSLNYEYITATTNGDIYLVGAERIKGKGQDVAVTRMQIPLSGGEPVRTHRTFGGGVNDWPIAATSTGDGVLVTGGTFDGLDWLNSPSPFFLMEVGPEPAQPWVTPFAPPEPETWRVTGAAYHADYGYYVAGTRYSGAEGAPPGSEYFVLGFAPK